MTKVSVVFEDKAVAVNGAGLILSELPEHDSTWRALQWDGKRGCIEKHDTTHEFFGDYEIVRPFVDAHDKAAQPHRDAGVPIGHALPPPAPYVEPPPPPPMPEVPKPVTPIVHAPKSAPTGGEVLK